MRSSPTPFLKSSLILGAVVACSAALAAAQTPGQATEHAPDGGVRETLQSISIPPLVNAPFSAVVETEWTKIMPDGSTATQKNHRIVARDNAGRIFQERRYLIPNGDTVLPPLSNLQYLDPARHEFYDCIPAEKTCYQSRYFGAALTSMPAPSAPPRQNAAGGATVEQEALGQKQIQELDVIGSRQVTTLSAGTIGNTKAQPIVKEFWYSPYLGVNLIVKRFDPRSGIQNFAVDHILLSEPDPKLFALPDGYRVVQVESRAAIR